MNKEESIKVRVNVRFSEAFRGTSDKPWKTNLDLYRLFS